MVTELRDYGFHVGIVGRSGLSQLKGIGANTIKIDKSFVDTITMDASTTTIVEMLVALARELHMALVAEGVESEHQVRALIACRVGPRLSCRAAAALQEVHRASREMRFACFGGSAQGGELVT